MVHYIRIRKKLIGAVSYTPLFYLLHSCLSDIVFSIDELNNFAEEVWEVKFEGRVRIDIPVNDPVGIRNKADGSSQFTSPYVMLAGPGIYHKLTAQGTSAF